MNSHSHAQLKPSSAPLRIQLPQQLLGSQETAAASATAATAAGLRAMNPPLDAPPFPPAQMQKCIRTTVRIQNIEKPQQEVLILTSMSSSVDSMILNNANQHQYPNGEEVDSLSESDFSDFSSDSSSSSFDDDDEEDENDDKMDEDSSVEEVEGNDDHNHHHSTNNGNNGNCNRSVNNGMLQQQSNAANGTLPQCTPAANNGNQGYRMKAYWLRKDPIRENHHGVFTSYIYYAKVLHKADLNWVLSGEIVAIKAVSWRCIRACRNRLSEDFVKEIAALQHITNYYWHNNSTTTSTGGKSSRTSVMDSIMESHILSADTVMSNETHLYIVMPYCDGGDLCERVAESMEMKFSEDEARYWFKHILKGLESLQQMKICHRDLSPENLIILNNKSLVIDFGMCLQIPYSDAGRHLISAQIPCGKLPHMSPELFRRQPFDGHAVDIWAAGTILLFMLTGKRLKNPPLVDRAFDHVDLGISNEATDLLRKMFRLDPMNRLSLEEVKNHPFVQYNQ